MTVVQDLLRLKAGSCWSTFGLTRNCGAQVQNENVARKLRISHSCCLPPLPTVSHQGITTCSTHWKHRSGWQAPTLCQTHHGTASAGQGQYCHAPPQDVHTQPNAPCVCSQVSYKLLKIERGLPACWWLGNHSEQRVATVMEVKRRSSEVWDPGVGGGALAQQWSELYSPIRFRLQKTNSKIN